MNAYISGQGYTKLLKYEAEVTIDIKKKTFSTINGATEKFKTWDNEQYRQMKN